MTNAINNFPHVLSSARMHSHAVFNISSHPSVPTYHLYYTYNRPLPVTTNFANGRHQNFAKATATMIMILTMCYMGFHVCFDCEFVIKCSVITWAWAVCLFTMFVGRRVNVNHRTCYAILIRQPPSSPGTESALSFLVYCVT